MLNLNDILWVVPGVIFIHFFNRRIPAQAIDLSGWPYVFFIVVIATITWLPAELILSLFNFNIENIVIELFIKLIASTFFALILLPLSRWKPIAKQIFSQIQDNFCKKCIKWENEFVILTLKNEKAYIGVLWKYPENPRARHESQTISIIPFQSGYRDRITKKVIWNTFYPEYKKEAHYLNMEVMIPRSEISTFGKFSLETFKFFKEQEQKSNQQSEKD